MKRAWLTWHGLGRHFKTTSTMRFTEVSVHKGDIAPIEIIGFAENDGDRKYIIALDDETVRAIHDVYNRKA